MHHFLALTLTIVGLSVPVQNTQAKEKLYAVHCQQSANETVASSKTADETYQVLRLSENGDGALETYLAKNGTAKPKLTRTMPVMMKSHGIERSLTNADHCATEYTGTAAEEKVTLFMTTNLTNQIHMDQIPGKLAVAGAGGSKEFAVHCGVGKAVANVFAQCLQNPNWKAKINAAREKAAPKEQKPNSERPDMKRGYLPGQHAF